VLSLVACIYTASLRKQTLHADRETPVRLITLQATVASLEMQIGEGQMEDMGIE